MPELQVTRQSDGLILASFGHVCVAVWSTKPTKPLFEAQRLALATTVARHPGRALFLCIISAKTEAPDQDLRDASAKMIASHGHDLAGCACVIEGTGFRAAITRTVLTGISLVLRSPVPSTFCDSAQAACEWLQLRSGATSLTGLVAQIAQLRGALPSGPGAA